MKKALLFERFFCAKIHFMLIPITRCKPSYVMMCSVKNIVEFNFKKSGEKIDIRI